MPIPERQRLPSSVANLKWVITDDGSRTLWDENLNETYHSGCGAVAETLWVYIKNSGILDLDGRCGSTIRILEYGLGTGTAFTLVAALAECLGFELAYYAIENTLLPSSIYRELDLQRSVESLPKEFVDEFESVLPLPEKYGETVTSILQRLASAVEQRPLESNAWNALHLRGDADRQEFRSKLHVFYGDAREETCVGDLRTRAPEGVDAIFFDPFSPETNPELWRQDVYRSAYEILNVGGTLTSYCVKSRVQKDLREVGFSIQKVPGPPGGKREVLRAVK